VYFNIIQNNIKIKLIKFNKSNKKSLINQPFYYISNHSYIYDNHKHINIDRQSKPIVEYNRNFI